jgi:hypothetical protein
MIVPLYIPTAISLSVYEIRTAVGVIERLILLSGMDLKKLAPRQHTERQREIKASWNRTADG